MSQIVSARTALSSNQTPESLVAEFAQMIHGMESEAARQGLTPIWDTVAIETDIDEVDSSSFSGALESFEINSLTARVRSITPEEAANANR
jgi:hypothetical protein